MGVDGLISSHGRHLSEPYKMKEQVRLRNKTVPITLMNACLLRMSGLSR